MTSTTATGATGKVTPTTDNRFTFDVLRHDGPVLVDYHAHWCRTCQLLEPVLDDLAPAWAGRLRIVSIDIDRHPGSAQRHHVQSIPTLVLFDHGVEKDRLINVIRRQRIDQWLHDQLDHHITNPFTHQLGDRTTPTASTAVPSERGSNGAHHSG